MCDGFISGQLFIQDLWFHLLEDNYLYLKALNLYEEVGSIKVHWV